MAKKKGGDQKTKSGSSRVPSQADGTNGKVMRLFDLIETIREELDQKFVSQGQYEVLPCAQEVFIQLDALLNSLSNVNTKSSQENLYGLLGKVISICRRLIQSDEKIADLDERLSQLSDEAIQIKAQSEVSNEAESFFATLTEFLQLFFEEFKALVEEYTEITSSVEERQNELEQRSEAIHEEISAILAGAESEDIKSYLFHARSRVIAFSRQSQALSASPVTDSGIKELDSSFETIERDHQLVLPVANSIRELMDKISEHKDNIESLKFEKAVEIKKRISQVRDEINKKLSIFTDLGKESLFWGSVYGLHEIFDYIPTDLLVYRVENDTFTALLEDLQKYLDKYSLGFDAFQKIKDSNSLKEVVAKKRTASKRKVIPSSKTLAISIGKNSPQKIDLVICALWAFVRAQLKKNPNDRRNGDYGRMPRVVARLLNETGQITDEVQIYLRENMIDILLGKGLISINKRMNPKNKVVQEFMILTDSGRAYGQQLETEYTALMDEIVRIRVEERQSYEKILKVRKKR